MEIDHYDPKLGSPRHVLVLASSEQHTPAHVVAVEDTCNNYLGTDGEQNALVRADLTFFETPSAEQYLAPVPSASQEHCIIMIAITIFLESPIMF